MKPAILLAMILLQTAVTWPTRAAADSAVDYNYAEAGLDRLSPGADHALRAAFSWQPAGPWVMTGQYARFSVPGGTTKALQLTGGYQHALPGGLTGVVSLVGQEDDQQGSTEHAYGVGEAIRFAPLSGMEGEFGLNELHYHSIGWHPDSFVSCTLAVWRNLSVSLRYDHLSDAHVTGLSVRYNFF